MISIVVKADQKIKHIEVRQVLFIIILTFAGFNALSAQQEDGVWLFGSSSMNAKALGYQFGNTVLDFSDIEPFIYYDSLITMDFGGTNASICDKVGNLLMYSNGMQIHGDDHKPILNGDTIAYSDIWEVWSLDDYYENGDPWLVGFPIIQGTLILPLEDQSNEFIVLYHLINTNENGSFFSSFNYSLVSRVEDSRFKVTAKDEVIKVDNFNWGQLNACRHANGRDWWVIQQNIEADSIFTYLVSELGVKLQNAFEKEPRAEVSVTASQVSFSPKGELYAVANGQYLNEIGGSYGTVIRVFNFDRCTGSVLELGTDTLQNFGIRATVAFSPSGRYMYTSNSYDLFQYDMQQEDWAATKELIATYDGFTFQYSENSTEFTTLFGSMALAPDGRIYSVPSGNSRFLHTIEYPDEEGLAADVQQHKIMMPTDNFTAIPIFPHYRLGPLEGSSCDTLGLDNYLKAQFRFAVDSTDYLNIRFTDVSYFEPDEWIWDFGDNTSHDGKNPYYHQYEEDGVYEVCLTVKRNELSDTFCKDLYLGVTSNHELLLTDDQVNLFPNPVQDFLNVELRDHVPKDLKIMVYNNLGEVVVSTGMNYGWNSINFFDQPKGIYHFVLVDSAGVKFSESFIKI